MANILTEVGQKYAITRWREKFGNQPDVNSQEFKDFHKQVNKDYNNKYAAKQGNDDRVEDFAVKLEKIAREKPQSFVQEFYNALTNLQKKGKINLCNLILGGNSVSDEDKRWIQVIGNLFNSGKNEAAEITLEAMKESAKYPWISGLVNHRLFKEDDFNLDNFDASVAGAGGMNISSDSDSTSTDTTSQDNNDFNLDDIDSSDIGGGDDLHIDPAGGAIDSIGGGMGGDEEIDSMGTPDPNAPTYRVIDVMFDEKDPEASPRVKVQNVETGEIEVKDIFEIDV